MVRHELTPGHEARASTAQQSSSGQWSERAGDADNGRRPEWVPDRQVHAGTAGAADRREAAGYTALRPPVAGRPADCPRLTAL